MKNVIVSLDDKTFRFWSDSAFHAGVDLPEFLSDVLSTFSDINYEVDEDE